MLNSIKGHALTCAQVVFGFSDLLFPLPPLASSICSQALWYHGGNLCPFTAIHLLHVWATERERISAARWQRGTLLAPPAMTLPRIELRAAKQQLGSVVIVERCSSASLEKLLVATASLLLALKSPISRCLHF